MYPEDLISVFPFFILIICFAMLMNEITRKREEE